MAPDPYHRVDAAGSADNLASRPLNDSTRSSGLRGRAISPIDIRSKVGRPKQRILQGGSTKVGIAGLDQQHATGGILRETRRNGAAGRTSPDDDVVIGYFYAAARLILNAWGCDHLICQGDGECRFDPYSGRQMKKFATTNLTGRDASLKFVQKELLF